MPSPVDICNLALSLIGDRANISAITPPDGSFQADRCAAFYPQARDFCLMDGAWIFAILRMTPAAQGTPPSQWLYSYSLPADFLKALAIFDPNDTADLSYPQVSPPDFWPWGASPEVPIPPPTDGHPLHFEIETQADGTLLLYCNNPAPILKYVRRVTDTTKYSPTFIEALSMYLGSKLAGPLIKGEEGRAVAKALMEGYLQLLAKAGSQDASQRSANRQSQTAWLVNRS